MRVLNIAVVGDIHYPTTKKLSGLDDKLSAPEALKKGMAKSPLASMIEDIQRSHEARPFDCILLVGDFTSRGDLAAFGDCLDYISSALSNTRTPIIGVPGNHDPRTPQLLVENDKRFLEFSKAAKAREKNVLLNYDSFRKFENLFANNAVALYALNSCAGCKALWDTAEKKGIGNILAETAKDINDEELYELFDAPYLDRDAINECIKDIETNHVRLPILLSHHNILPQITPRIAIFPEMLNSGFARRQLARISAPVIYIHGHIHDDPIEVISNPENFSQAGLVTISAPLFCEGYLQIRILMSDKTPISLSVRKRKLASGILDQKIVTVPLYSRQQTEDLLPIPATSVLQHLKSNPTTRYEDLVATYGNDAIEYLECANFLKISRGLLDEPKTWRVERADA